MPIKKEYFCQNIKNGEKCGNLLTKDFDEIMFARIGLCCSCEADLHTHLSAKKLSQKLKLLDFLKNHKNEIYLDEETHDIVVNMMKIIMDDDVELVDGANKITELIDN